MRIASKQIEKVAYEIKSIPHGQEKKIKILDEEVRVDLPMQKYGGASAKVAAFCEPFNGAAILSLLMALRLPNRARGKDCKFVKTLLKNYKARP